MGFLLSTVVAALVYYLGCCIWPVPIYPKEVQPKDESWEAMRYTEGFFPDDEVIPEYLRGKVLDGQLIHVNADKETALPVTRDEKLSI